MRKLFSIERDEIVIIKKSKWDEDGYVVTKRFVESVLKKLNSNNINECSNLSFIVINPKEYHLLIDDKIEADIWIHEVYSCGCKEYRELSYDEFLGTAGTWRFDYEDGIFILEYGVNKVCDNCISVRKLKDSCRPDNILQNSIYSHSITTDYVDYSNKPVQMLVNTINKYEVCCTWKTQHIGTVGFYLKGNVTLGSNVDLYSEINSYGERIFDTDCFEYMTSLVYDRDDLDLYTGSHTEFFVIPTEIIGVWAKQAVYKYNRKYVDSVVAEASRLLNRDIPLFIVENNR